MAGNQRSSVFAVLCLRVVRVPSSLEMVSNIRVDQKNLPVRE